MCTRMVGLIVGVSAKCILALCVFEFFLRFNMHFGDLFHIRHSRRQHTKLIALEIWMNNEGKLRLQQIRLCCLWRAPFEQYQALSMILHIEQTVQNN